MSFALHALLQTKHLSSRAEQNDLREGHSCLRKLRRSKVICSLKSMHVLSEQGKLGCYMKTVSLPNMLVLQFPSLEPMTCRPRRNNSAACPYYSLASDKQFIDKHIRSGS